MADRVMVVSLLLLLSVRNSIEEISSYPWMHPFPFILVADEAFPLKRNLMRPYPGRGITEEQHVFNYRLSRARRVVEHAFGILASRFRVYHRAINMKPANVERVIKATCVLHNLPQENNVADNGDHQPTSGEHSREAMPFEDLRGIASNRPTGQAIDTRNTFKDYFLSAGHVEWQEHMVR